jgi:hypothetical protein
VTCVCDPSQCRHISPTSLSCARLLQTYIANHSSLAAWDKRVHKGFWRLLVVREGRQHTFLPVPQYSSSSGGGEAMETDGAPPPPPAAAGGGGGGVLQGVSLADLPLEEYLVKRAQAGEQAPGKLYSQVLESEPAAPFPDEVLVVFQVGTWLFDRNLLALGYCVWCHSHTGENDYIDFCLKSVPMTHSSSCGAH